MTDHDRLTVAISTGRSLIVTTEQLVSAVESLSQNLDRVLALHGVTEKADLNPVLDDALAYTNKAREIFVRLEDE